MKQNPPVNCGATVPRVNLENLSDDSIIGLYCSRTGSTEVLINSEAAYTNQNFNFQDACLRQSNLLEPTDQPKQSPKKVATSST